MRIDKRTASTLVEIAREHFGDVEVRLFGSRLDDSRRGGDIDIQIFAPESTYRDEVAFLADVEQRLGERVDLRVQRGEPLLIDTIAMDAGIVLSGMC
jgi:predicted nucleotidyltransferase